MPDVEACSEVGFIHDAEIGLRNPPKTSLSPLHINDCRDVGTCGDLCGAVCQNV